MPKSTYVAFLRGINVGGNRIIKNTELTECFERMGLEQVTVVLQTGNVVFKSDSKNQDSLVKMIEQNLSHRFTYPAKVIVRMVSEVTEIIDEYPFSLQNTLLQQYVVFCAEEQHKEELLLASSLDPAVEKILPGKGVIYWTVTKGMTTQSIFGKLISKAKYKDTTTTRNINTLQKIVGLGAIK